MPDQNKRALLIEAVIAGGLIVIGIPAGQPLLALAASMGGNWAYSLAERGFQHWRDRWFTDDGVLNHGIVQALCHAFVDAVRQVEYDWKQQRHYQYLRHKSPEQAQLTLDTLRLLREDGTTLFQQLDQLAQVVQQQQHDRVLSLLDQDKSKANEYLKSVLAAFLYGHDDEFVTFVTEQLGPKWILRFLEILKDPDEEGTRAWRACQLLWQKSLMLGIEQIKQIEQTTAETAETVRWLQEWAQKLQTLPPTERNPVGQDALEFILHAVHAQLSEMQETLDKTYATALEIKATLEQVYTKEVPAHSAPSPIWTVPYRRNPFFTGRDNLLAQLHERLSSTRMELTQPQVISGLGGIGKTQIAVEYAYRHKNDYHVILWVNAATHETLIGDFLTIARLLALPAKDERDQRLVVADVQHWLATHEQWLLILDNADDVSLASEFLPTGDTGHILLTSREPAWGLLASSLEVEKMSKTEGVLFLLRRAKILRSSDTSLSEASSVDQISARAIVQEMDGLPLALDQAGAYIEETPSTLDRYLKAYQRRQQELLRVRGRASKDHPAAVATTWSLNFEQVERLSPMAADLLRFLAFLAPGDIPEEMIVAGASELGPQLQAVASDETLLDQPLKVLSRFSLVRRNTEKHLLFIHRLVQAVLKATMTDKAQHEWAERTVQAVNLAFPRVPVPFDDLLGVETSVQCERLLPHALACAELINEYTLDLPKAARLLTQTGHYLDHNEEYEQAEPLYQRALTIREKVLGLEHPDAVMSLHYLVSHYHDQGKDEQAESLMQCALAIREKVLGLEHPDAVMSLHYLAALYSDQGEYEEAELLTQRALSICEKQLGPEHPHTAQSLHYLAALYSDQGKSEEAEPLFQRVQDIAEKFLGPEHPKLAKILDNLARNYERQGKYEEAEPLYERALAISEKQWGPEHPDIVTSLDNLARNYERQGKYEEAELLMQRALAINEKAYEPKSSTFNHLARFHYALGEYEQAETFYQRALAMSEQQLGPEHQVTATNLNDLAEFYYTQGKYEEAEPLFQRALAIREKVLGLEHPYTKTVRENYVRLLEEMKQKGKRQH